MKTITLGDYRLAADRYYDRATHLWVDLQGPARARIGFDPLGSETSGDVVAVAFEPVGTAVARGAAFGSLEAAKFVGPLTAPVSGTLTAHNPEVLANPARINADPLGAWLVEVELTAAGELAALLSDPGELASWFAAEVERFRERGAIAE